MRRRIETRTLLENGAVVLVIGIVAILIANVIAFVGSRNRLPPETRLGDVDVSGMTVDEAIAATVARLRQPVTLRHLDENASLDPEAIGFRVNESVARLQLEALIAAQQGLDKLPAFILSQYRPTQLPLPYQYSEPKLQALLSELAGKYNREARPPVPDLATATVTPGQDGALLNTADAYNAVLLAMQSSLSRTVDLPVDVVPLGEVSVKTLEPMLTERLKAFTDRPGNLAGVFIKDLRNGEEWVVNGDVAFSGAGWLKLAIVVEAFRQATSPVPQALRAQLAMMASQGGAAEINEVLRALGNGDPQAGIDRVNLTLHKLGLRNTFLAQPFGQLTHPPTIITPANARGDINAAPDQNAQSTVADVAVLLEMIEQCRNGTGGMILALSAEITPEKCNAMLDVIAANAFTGLLAAGSGEATVLHRQSWDARNHGDAALIRSPQGDYVLAVMLHGADALDWTETSALIGDLARLVYGFFNARIPPAAPPIAAPPPP